jgi:hypothetical protein
MHHCCSQTQSPVNLEIEGMLAFHIENEDQLPLLSNTKEALKLFAYSYQI